MAKKDNQTVQATLEQRRLADQITKARKYSKDWKVIDAKLSTELKDTTPVDTTLLCGTDEVASITESSPTTSYDYAAYFAANPAAEADLHKNYRKPPTTTVTLTTKWIEPDPAVTAPIPPV